MEQSWWPIRWHTLELYGRKISYFIKATIFGGSFIYLFFNSRCLHPNWYYFPQEDAWDSSWLFEFNFFKVYLKRALLWNMYHIWESFNKWKAFQTSSMASRKWLFYCSFTLHLLLYTTSEENYWITNSFKKFSIPSGTCLKKF